MQKAKKSSPLQWVPSVYFAMGLPFVMLSLVSVVMLKDLGISDAKITFWASLVTLPWSLKPLWSPFLEMFKTKKYFVVGTQLITGISFALLALSIPLPNFFTYTVALMGMIAFSGATHDIATDGTYMNELDTSTQAKYIGWQGAFFNIAKVVCNGGLVYLAGVLMAHIGAMYAWMTIMAICAGVMIVLSLYHSHALPSGGASSAKLQTLKDGWASFTEVFTTFFRKQYIWYYIIFIILYRIAEGLAIKVLPLFLKASPAEGGIGLTNENYGLIVGTLGTLAFIVGSILGGHFIAKRGLRKTIFLLCCIINLPFLFYLVLAMYQPTDMAIISTAIVCEYFGYGFGFVGLMLFMMQQVAPGKHKMAHYAFASGIMNLGYMLAGMISGWLSDTFGYATFFMIVAVSMIPALVLARTVPFTVNEQTGERENERTE
ncbi:MAG: MFS transporter [Bacteroidales bacterium]|jgi:PAT family beta-lactamase induction signal transducer AmpG|nr:MFS transporter [Bacteroidales bacterium]